MTIEFINSKKTVEGNRYRLNIVKLFSNMIVDLWNSLSGYEVLSLNLVIFKKNCNSYKTTKD